MISRPLVLGLLAAGCITAAAGGAYVAVRQNETARTTTALPAANAPSATAAPSTTPQAVAETEAVVTPPQESKTAAVEAPANTTKKSPIRGEKDENPSTAAKKETPRPSRPSQPAANRKSTSTAAANQAPAPLLVERPSPPRDANSPAHSPAQATPAQPEPVVPELPAPPPRPQIVEVVIPASSVVGLQVETSISSETARVEDRVEARVTRDVIADGRVAIPAGTRAIGDVTLVERGGKMKDKARLGVRFHTLVLADGNQVPLRTDTIFREGSSPGSESARKIGGAAVGGAILGAIIGGAKGAAIGGATGAGAGSAVVMAGDRNAATLPAGTIVTVRLSTPVTVDVEREL
jgi:hypothetical protein